MQTYSFVNFCWDDAKAASLDLVGRLIYRSNLLGSDQRITNTGGGNTSAMVWNARTIPPCQAPHHHSSCPSNAERRSSIFDRSPKSFFVRRLA
ncbi:MAG: hypothetical protein ACK49N_10085 [Verrucomicrobiota bacterium]